MCRTILWRVIIVCLVLILCCPATAWAESLGDRLASYPDWENFPAIAAVQGSEDLVYPQWMAGTWQVTSTLIEQVAPFAPEIVTPGFEQNKSLINQPFEFRVRFQPQQTFFTKAFTLPKLMAGTLPIVADREFNGLEIARSYLGETGVKTVKVDPRNPNRQLTRLGNNQILISTVTGRSIENLDNEFLTSEITQQQFRGAPQLYLNQVETTTDYQQISPEMLTANQVTAIYLTANDPDFFTTQNHPVALYRYNLSLQKID
ncbi:MAG: hypothetical protein HC799_15355 [Limnothrix sp. RL_2_0]|nr:hypothetical protein [Limnothrix sp. RL_2_0]